LAGIFSVSIVVNSTVTHEVILAGIIHVISSHYPIGMATNRTGFGEFKILSNHLKGFFYTPRKPRRQNQNLNFAQGGQFFQHCRTEDCRLAENIDGIEILQ